MKDTVWRLFELTGNPAYYVLYRKLKETNGQIDQGADDQIG